MFSKLDLPQPDYLDGGAAVSGSGVQTLDILVVVVPPDELLTRLVPAGGAGRGASADGNVFPALGRFVDGIRYAPQPPLVWEFVFVEGDVLLFSPLWVLSRWCELNSRGAEMKAGVVFRELPGVVLGTCLPSTRV